MPTAKVVDLFKEEREIKGINILTLGRDTVEYEELQPAEVDAVRKAVKFYVDMVAKQAPSVARDLAEQLYFTVEGKHLGLAIKVAMIAKALMDSKPITFPSRVGTIGVNPLIPQFIRYVATPTADYPAYTDYPANSWDLSLTAGRNVYLFGSETNYFRYPSLAGRRAIAVIVQNGVVEVGTTPKIDQFRIISEASTQLGVFNVEPLVEVPVEAGKAVYQYPTPGAVILWNDMGIKWYGMPIKSGVSSIRLLGLVFYEHEFMPDTKYVS